MARPLRIEYPDAWYHVMNRGRRGEHTFSDNQDYIMFTALLKEIAGMWNVRIAAYCLMPNHYHMLIQTPDAKKGSGPLLTCFAVDDSKETLWPVPFA